MSSALTNLIQKVEGVHLLRRKAEVIAAPLLTEPVRFPYGPFRFRANIPRGLPYSVLASSDLINWLNIANGTSTGDAFEYVDSDASKSSYRFYRLLLDEVPSNNIVGYVSVFLPPGFSLIANPLKSVSNSIADLFRNWPNHTTLNKFDTRVFHMIENEVTGGRWTNPAQRLDPGEGAILHNPTSDFRNHNFVGEVLTSHASVPIPSGFSLRSTLLPQSGNLADDLGFPIANGDVIHLFDRDRQKYVLHSFDNDRWSPGPPIISVGESFWVAKAEAGNWIKRLNS
jgi:hypothetical protein